MVGVWLGALGLVATDCSDGQKPTTEIPTGMAQSSLPLKAVLSKSLLLI